MSSNQQDPHPLANVKVLFFDVFGTVADWRSTVTAFLLEECRAALDAHDATSTPTTPAPDNLRFPAPRAREMYEHKWGDFAAEWRAEYGKFTRDFAKLEPGSAPYVNIDAHHLQSLRKLLAKWELTGLWREPEGVERISRVWHVLDGWKDSADGIRALNGLGFKTSTLSNGNVELLEDMARHARFEWTYVTSSAMFESYKPNPAVYKGAAKMRECDLEKGEACLVAAHLNDLEAAKECGYRTVYVARSREEAWDQEKVEKARSEGWVDVWVDEDQGGFLEVARRLEGVKTIGGS